MESFKSKIEIIPGIGFRWTGRDGQERVFDLVDEILLDPDVVEECTGIEEIGEFVWNQFGLPDKVRS